jgi:hypothetical protein
MRLKKMLGSLFICVFVLFWVVLAVGLLPILAWMEKSKTPNPATRRK